MAAFLGSWSWDPTVVLGLALSAGLYTVGWRRLYRRGPGRPVFPVWRVWCFAGGLASMGLALLSPIEVFSELFFFFHMTQHLLLMLAAAPLLLLGAPLLPVLWALPRSLRVRLGALFVPTHRPGRVFSTLTRPLVAMVLFVAMMALWHVPVFYDAAQGRTATHDLEHLLFFGSALLYWWPVIHPGGGRRRLGYAAAIPYLVPPMLEGNLIGALLTFAERPLYETYQRVPRLWGISVVQDQQIAGLIMWVGGGMFYLIPIFALLTSLLRQEERSAGESSSAERLAEDGTPGNTRLL